MQKIALAAMVSLGMVGAAGLAVAAVPPVGSGSVYTNALNVMSSEGYHDMNLISQKGDMVHATAMTRANKSVSLWVNTANGTVKTTRDAGKTMTDPPKVEHSAAKTVEHSTTKAKAAEHSTAKKSEHSTVKTASTAKTTTGTAKTAHSAAKTTHSRAKKG